MNESDGPSTSIEQLRAMLESRLSRSMCEALDISYSPGGSLPPSARLSFGQHRFRLEFDAQHREWILASDEPQPRLLDHFMEGNGELREWLREALARHSR